MTRKLLIVLIFLATYSGLAHTAEQLYSSQPPITPDLAASGAWPVGVRALSIVHRDQLDARDFRTLANRELVLEVWYPAEPAADAPYATYENVTRLHKTFSLQGEAYRAAPPVAGTRFPLVVLSHGYTGYRTIMFYLAEHLASHGYVVASIDHTDSTNAEIDFANSGGSGFASTLLNRARDQQYVLDALAALDTPLANSINTDTSAVIGYSMGGYGALNTVGGCYDYSQQKLEAFGFPAAAAAPLVAVYNSCNAGRESVDPRWKAMVAFSPWGQEQRLHKVSGIRVPSLFVAGSHDDISGFSNGIAALFEESGADFKYMMVYENARHNIAAHPAPAIAYETEADLGHYVEPSWHTEQLNRINEHMTLAFLDCHLKSLEAGCNYLPVRDDIAQNRGADGSLSDSWPGFRDRWGLGVRFYRGNKAAEAVDK
jgi:predicted dienelactone hydrolase